jgi:hypothetical protein
MIGMSGFDNDCLSTKKLKLEFFKYHSRARESCYMTSMMNIRKLPLEWDVSGVAIPFTGEFDFKFLDV